MSIKHQWVALLVEDLNGNIVWRIGSLYIPSIDIPVEDIQYWGYPIRRKIYKGPGKPQSFLNYIIYGKNNDELILFRSRDARSRSGREILRKFLYEDYGKLFEDAGYPFKRSR